MQLDYELNLMHSFYHLRHLSHHLHLHTGLNQPSSIVDDGRQPAATSADDRKTADVNARLHSMMLASVSIAKIAKVTAQKADLHRDAMFARAEATQLDKEQKQEMLNVKERASDTATSKAADAVEDAKRAKQEVTNALIRQRQIEDQKEMTIKRAGIVATNAEEARRLLLAAEEADGEANGELEIADREADEAGKALTRADLNAWNDEHEYKKATKQ